MERLGVMGRTYCQLELQAAALADSSKAQPKALPSTWTAVGPCKEQELEAL